MVKGNKKIAAIVPFQSISHIKTRQMACRKKSWPWPISVSNRQQLQMDHSMFPHRTKHSRNVSQLYRSPVIFPVPNNLVTSFQYISMISQVRLSNWNAKSFMQGTAAKSKTDPGEEKRDLNMEGTVQH